MLSLTQLIMYHLVFFFVIIKVTLSNPLFLYIGSGYIWNLCSMYECDSQCTPIHHMHMHVCTHCLVTIVHPFLLYYNHASFVPIIVLLITTYTDVHPIMHDRTSLFYSFIVVHHMHVFIFFYLVCVQLFTTKWTTVHHHLQLKFYHFNTTISMPQQNIVKDW